ncbi:unnamed protein product [Ostreobium quekettii]|uniref:Histone deacetylase complex subunit SAP30 Sin3 binding domain-containing protein n=1 Tax=Ostreobium quekettii TaxID=121088 RepID=A0A8S1J3Y0_9CHLO|nr:unnamed protein product [Ostreobium quekettii]|eukprot:evm.model.scf_59.3 EVM.evm.TU.scf_59.3   scf_59:11537-11860(-)
MPSVPMPRPASTLPGKFSGDGVRGGEGRAVDDALWTKPIVDLSKLKNSSLRRYVKLYHVRGVWLCSGKDELCRVVTAHFAQMPVDERSVILRLRERLRANRKRPGKQ